MSNTLMAAILARLRDATGAQHRELDARVSMALPFGRDDYVRFLLGSRAVVAPVERALGEVPDYAAHVRFAARRRRSALLDRDLTMLGASPAPASPPPTASPTGGIGGLAAAFGAAYVLEGSTLGSATIARTLSPELARSSAYLSAYGDELGAMWRAWVEDLEAFAETAPADAHDALVASACATFESFARALSFT